MPPKRAAAKKATTKTNKAPAAKRGGRKTKAELAAEKEAAEQEQQQEEQQQQQQTEMLTEDKQDEEEQHPEGQCDQNEDEEEIKMASKAVRMEVEAKQAGDKVKAEAKKDHAEPMETDEAEHTPKPTRKGKGKAVIKESAAKKAAEEDTQDTQDKEEATPVEQDTHDKEQSSEGASSNLSSEQKPLTMKERMEKLKSLRQQMNQSKQANRADLMSEHQRSKSNPREEARKERIRQEAEKMLQKQEMEDAGEDYERSQFWGYSVESVEQWNEKQEIKKERRNNDFVTWGHANHKKYLRQTAELKPNLAAYNAKKEQASSREDGDEDAGFYRDANSVAFVADAKPNQSAVDRMAADVVKQMDERLKRYKRKAHDEEADVNYINDANQRFNQKLSKFYDRFTKEIRENFERGTAL